MSNVRPYISSGYESSTWWDYQIYDGENDVQMGVSNYVVPAIGDFVNSRNGNVIVKQLVTGVVNQIATLETVYDAQMSDSVDDLTVNDMSATAMVLVRNSVTPIIAAVHVGLPIESGIHLAYAKLFTGTDIYNLDAVISRQYDADNVVIDNTIEVVKDELNEYRYHCEQFHVDRILEDKSNGTLVFYGADDTPVAKYTVVFRVSDTLVNFSGSDLFITDLIINSVSLNPLNNREILVERGFLNSTFNPRIFKQFNTGQMEEISLTSRDLTLEGWGNYVIGEENDTFPLTVLYTLASNEQSDMVSNEAGTVISAEYTIRVIDDADSTNYKLYPVLRWTQDSEQYLVRFHMYDSTYKTSVDVTDSISLSNAFDGSNFDTLQTFNFSVDLKAVGITLDDSIMTGSFAIQLNAEPMGATTPFVIRMVPTDDTRYYGEALRARLKYDLGMHVVSIDSDYTSFDEWLDNVYYKLLPAYDSNTNSQAPQPTHCDVYINNQYLTVDVRTQWNTGVKWNYDVPTGLHTAELHWYSYDSDGGRNYLARSSMQLEIV